MQLCGGGGVYSNRARTGSAPVVRRAPRRVLVDDDDDGALHFVDETDVVIEADSLRDGVAAVEAADDAAQEAAVLAHLKRSVSVES